MKTKITRVIIQLSSNTVFTYYQLGSSKEYYGSEPCSTLEKAKEVAQQRINTWNRGFMSVAKEIEFK